MEATTYTCQPDEDFAECEICERTVFDDWRTEYGSGVTVCGDCERAEYERFMRSLPPEAHYATDEQIRADEAEVIAWCGHDSDEALKAATLVARLD